MKMETCCSPGVGMRAIMLVCPLTDLKPVLHRLAVNACQLCCACYPLVIMTRQAGPG